MLTQTPFLRVPAFLAAGDRAVAPPGRGAPNRVPPSLGSAVPGLLPVSPHTLFTRNPTALRVFFL